MDEVLYTCRFVHFTAAMVIFGAGSFRLYALAGSDARAAASVLAAFDASLRQVIDVAAILALLSALALLLGPAFFCRALFKRRTQFRQHATGVLG